MNSSTNAAQDPATPKRKFAFDTVFDAGGSILRDGTGFKSQYTAAEVAEIRAAAFEEGRQQAASGGQSNEEGAGHGGGRSARKPLSLAVRCLPGGTPRTRGGAARRVILRNPARTRAPGPHRVPARCARWHGAGADRAGGRGVA